MLARLRWSIYRNALAGLIWVSFRQQPVYPVVIPSDTTVEFDEYGASFPQLPLPGLWQAQTFPDWEHAPPRLRRIALTRIALAVLRWIDPDAVNGFIAAVMSALR